MKLITHVHGFMLNTWPSQQVLKVSTWTSRHAFTRRSIFGKVRWRVSSVIAWISLSLLFRKSCSVRGLFPYTRPLRMPHSKKSGGVRSSDRGGRSSLEMILSSKKDSDALTHDRSVWIALHWHATLTQSPIPTAAVTGATDTSTILFLVFRLCFDACMFAQPSFVFSMKLCTRIITCTFMLLSCCWMFWLKKVYRHFFIRKLVRHPVYNWLPVWRPKTSNINIIKTRTKLCIIIFCAR
jgi:hypothetical protein